MFGLKFNKSEVIGSLPWPPSVWKFKFYNLEVWGLKRLYMGLAVQGLNALIWLIDGHVFIVEHIINSDHDMDNMLC